MGNSLLGGSRRSSSSSSPTRTNNQRSSASSSSSSSSLSATKINKQGWNDAVVLKLIEGKKLACKESCAESDSTCECPICFLTYDRINLAKCCKQFICTSCYLLVKSSPSSLPPCPFCNSNNFDVKCVNSVDIVNANNPSSPSSSVHSISSDAISPPSSVKKSPTYIPVASIDDRKAIEKEIKKSRSLTRDMRDESSPIRSVLRNRHNSDSTINISVAHDRLMASSTNSEGIYIGGQRITDRVDMGTIEDMMMNEAIRRSLVEASPQSSVAASSQSSAVASPQPPEETSQSTTRSSASIQRTSARHIDDIESVYNEMSEEEQLVLAISLSMNSDNEKKESDDNDDSKASIDNDNTTSQIHNNDDSNMVSTKLIDTNDDELIYGSIDNMNTNKIGSSDSDSNNNDRSHDLLSKIDRILGHEAVPDDSIENDNIVSVDGFKDNDGCEHIETVADNSINDINDIIINEILTNNNNDNVISNSDTNTNNDILL